MSSARDISLENSSALALKSRDLRFESGGKLQGPESINGAGSYSHCSGTCPGAQDPDSGANSCFPPLCWRGGLGQGNVSAHGRRRFGSCGGRKASALAASADNAR